MGLSQDIIQNGSVIIYDDTDMTLVSQIDDCRMKKYYKEIIMGYTLLNPFVVFG